MAHQTNLVIPEDLVLPKDKLKKGFMFLYNKGYTGSPIEAVTRLWAAVFAPTVTAKASFGKDRTQLRKYSIRFQDSGAAGYLSLKKDNANQLFELVLPVAILPLSMNSADNMSSVELVGYMGSVLLDQNDYSEVYNQASDRYNLSYSGDQVLAHASPVMRAGLGSECLAGISVKSGSNSSVICLHLKINKLEAQHLTSTPWLEIRTTDLHPLLMQWCASGFGQLEKAPPSAFSVSKIAKTLPPTGIPRVDKYGLTISSDGTPFYVPAVLDNTKRYEDLYTQAGIQEDGSYALLTTEDLEYADPENKEKKVNLPKNVPVLVDWVNNKNAFTNTQGILQVQDMSRFQAANSSHVASILANTSLDDKTFSKLANIAYTAGMGTAALINAEEAAEINANSSGMNLNVAPGITTEEYFNELLKAHTANSDQLTIPLRYFVPDSPEYSPIFRFFKGAYQAVLDNIEAVNTKYSVSYASVNFATIILIAKYCADYPAVVAASNTMNSAALKQSVDPDWTVPSLPLNNGIKFLPHQQKVRNLLKDSPSFAILPVQAGGGKTVIIITDILLEIKANRSQPYLIMCPPHLVAQYVKEIVFFTGGKLNVVPISSYVVKRTGLKRLGAMLEAAPRNTVVVCDYDVLRYRAYNICYGTSNVTVYPVIEFLQSFKFGYAACDESHYLKNASGRSRAAMALLASIPKKRLASGTMAHDSPSDLALQVAILDPTVFGNKAAFNEKFGEEVSGDRVIKWKPGAQKAIMDAIRSKVVVAGAMRKEWAALLPTAIEKLHAVKLTTNQQIAYQSILTKVKLKLEEDAKASKNKKLLDFVGNKDVKDEDDGEATDEFSDEALIAMLQPYLARLEQFCTAPARDEYGDTVLKGEDRISPKVLKVYECIREHLDNRLPGKIIVFTTYTASAEDIYDNMPPDLKAQTLLYLAAEKTEAIAKFETDANCKILVGVEQSMNTGLNLQSASRLIRTESCWNPGTLEQGNARINRPELKKVETRATIYFDWLIASGTIDVTKIARLISKIIAIGKFENTDTDFYDTVPDVPVIKMNLDSVFTYNDLSTTLVPYAQAFKEYNQAKHDDYADYKAKYKEKYGDLELKPTVIAPDPKDAKLMRDVPYVPGLELPAMEKLGLVRLDQFFAIEDTNSEDEDGDSKDNGKHDLRALLAKIQGQVIHTEVGDGIAKSLNILGTQSVEVDLGDGNTIKVKLSSAFLVTKPLVSSKDVRDAIADHVGMSLTDQLAIPNESMEFSEALKLKLAKQKAIDENKRKKELKKNLKAAIVELHFTVSNGYLGLTYFLDDKNPEMENVLAGFGFRPTPQFYHAEIKTGKALLKQFDMWKAAGFTIDKAIRNLNVSGGFQTLLKLLNAGKVKTHALSYQFGTKAKLFNFYRSEAKPSIDAEALKPYPMIEDGHAYIILPYRGQAATRAAIKIKAPTVRWSLSEPSLGLFCSDVNAAIEAIKNIVDADVQISNIEDLRLEARKLKKTKFIEDDGSPLVI